MILLAAAMLTVPASLMAQKKGKKPAKTNVEKVPYNSVILVVVLVDETEVITDNKLKAVRKCYTAFNPKSDIKLTTTLIFSISSSAVVRNTLCTKRTDKGRASAKEYITETNRLYVLDTKRSTKEILGGVIFIRKLVGIQIKIQTRFKIKLGISRDCNIGTDTGIESITLNTH